MTGEDYEILGQTFLNSFKKQDFQTILERDGIFLLVLLDYLSYMKCSSDSTLFMMNKIT